MAKIGDRIPKKEIRVNAKGEQCAQDEKGYWRQVGADGRLKSQFATDPTKPATAEEVLTQVGADELQRLTADVAELKNTFATFHDGAPARDELEQFEQSLAEVAAEVANLKEGLERFGAVDDLVQKVQVLVADLKTKVDNLNTAFGAHDKSINGLAGKVDELTDKVSEFKSAPPASRGGQPKEEKSMQRLLLGVFAVIAAIVAILYFFPGILNPGKVQIADTRPPAAIGQGQTRDVADVTKLIDERIAPLNERVSRVEESVATLDGRFSTFQNTMDSVKALLEKTTAADNLARQMDRLRAECPAEFLKDALRHSKEMSKEQEASTVEHCRRLKAEKRITTQPAGPTGAEVAHGQQEDPVASEEEGEVSPPGMRIAGEMVGARQAGYRPGYGHGYGPRRGARRAHCPPGFHLDRTSGGRELCLPPSPNSRWRGGGVPVGKCQPGERRTVIRGGYRYHVTCR